MKHKPTNPPKRNPAVIIGTPVWTPATLKALARLFWQWQRAGCPK